MKRVTIALVAGVLALPLAAGPAEAHDHGPRAADDHLHARSGRTLTADLLRNDRGTAVVRHTAAAHGTVDLGPDGTLRYTPAPGFTGRDSFTYTVSDAVKLYPTHLKPLATIGGVEIKGGAYGSALTPVPGERDEFYGLTDRGPNVDAPGGGKIERYVQADVAIEHGFSGGALIDVSGRLIGLNSAGVLRGTPLTLAVSTLERVVSALLTHGRIQRGYLGVSSSPARLPEAAAERAGQRVGLILTGLQPGGPAETAGFLLGDVLLTLDGQALGNIGDLQAALEDRAGRTVAVKILRAGNVQEVSVTPTARS